MKRLSSNRAVQLACALALGGALASGAHAQSAQVPLNGLGAAPQNGSLPTIAATWSVTGGTQSTGWDTITQGTVTYSHYNGASQMQTWTFDKPVDLSFTITGLNGAHEGIELHQLTSVTSSLEDAYLALTRDELEYQTAEPAAV